MPTLSTVQRHPRYPTNVPVELIDPQAAQRYMLRLENISLGGTFVRSTVLVPPGTRIRLRLVTRNGFEVNARSVHTIDQASGARKRHPPGVGLTFEEMSPYARSRLTELVDAIALSATVGPQPTPVPHAPKAPPRPMEAVARAQTLAFRAGPAKLQVGLSSNAELLDLWVRELSKGRLFVHAGEALELRAHLRLELQAPHGAFGVDAEVVHQVLFEPTAQPPIGVGLELLGFGAAERRALEQFVRGAPATVPGETEAAQPATLESVLDEVRKFFCGLEQGRPSLALGLDPKATAQQQRARLLELKGLFSCTPAGASAPQMARIDAAQRALTRLERQQSVRDHTIPGELAIFTEEAPDELEAPAPKQSVASISDRQRAEDFVTKAEVFVVSDMPRQALNAVTQALTLCREEPLMERALAVCIRIPELAKAVSIAREVTAANPRNAQAWRALLSIYESKGHHALALHAAQALLEIDPRAAELRSRIARLKSKTTRH